MIRRQNLTGEVLFLLLLCASVFAAHIKVDMDTRSDATASGFLSWLPTDGTSKTFGDVTVSFAMQSPPASTAWKINWYNKDGLNKYELAMDCLYAEYDYNNGEIKNPSFNGGTFLLTLTGLTEGPHTLITYHNAPWPMDKYNRTIAPCKIYVDDVEQFTVQPSQGVANDNDVVSTFFAIQATAGQPVVILLEPTGDPNTQICTAVLNGFEIDNLASVDSYASEPVPADGDGHVFADNDDPATGMAQSGTVTLNWTPSPFAVAHDVYFGTSPTEVQNAVPAPMGIYKGRQAGNETTWTASGLDSKEIYYWRIDTIKSDDSITKGYLWSFRVRRRAFPTAEGYGRFARGGRFGRVVEVTSLEDYTTDAGEPVLDGSLRKAIEVEKGPRIVVFRVGGTVFLKKKLIIPADGGDVYVAGQTAPGEGICVARYPFGMLGAKDAIIRFVRTRVGDFAQASLDGMGMASSDHCIIDHCSISWSIDEGHSSRSAKNITFSRNIISEALNDSYQYADHSYAASISGNLGSYHHNLLAHCAGRNWSLAGGLDPSGQYDGFCDIRNNIVYNWLNRTTDGGVMRCNFVSNFYIPGPATRHFLLMRPDGDQMGTGNPQMFYIVGNKMEGRPQYDADNWLGVSPNYATMEQIRSDVPFFPSYVATHSVEEAYSSVLADVGATRPRRDAIDARIIEDVINRTYHYRGSIDNLPGIIDSQTDVGGYPILKDGPVPADSDHDGLPDWREVQLGLNVQSPIGDYSDTNGDPDGDGYTNMDDYLDYLAQGGAPFETYHCTEGLLSDYDGDCRVDLIDFELFASAWESQSPAADLNTDEMVDIMDAAMFVRDWLDCHRSPLTECWP
jgi:hypothetical protein